MEPEPPSEVTRLLQDWRGGDRNALDALLPLVYKELRRLAHLQLRKERPDQTLQSAALVHEAYFRLVGVSPPQWESRTHFFAIASQLMRQILVDYARRHGAAKRGASICKLSVDEAAMASREKDVDVVALDDALQALARSMHDRVASWNYASLQDSRWMKSLRLWKSVRPQCNAIGRRPVPGFTGN
jgi:RNA polymerase sigma-70 factor (ECF subfamily)